MRSHGRHGCRRLLSTLDAALGFLSPCPAPAETEPERGPPEMLEDAELTDVCFVDSDQGWAVGDRGVIWHTEDGGRHWQLQRAPETCRLESVHFLDPQTRLGRGWTGPSVHAPDELCRAADPGRWSQLDARSGTDACRRSSTCSFSTAQRGWAVGNASALYPTGIFRTEDGGRSWSTVADGRGRPLDRPRISATSKRGIVAGPTASWPAWLRPAVTAAAGTDVRSGTAPVASGPSQRCTAWLAGWAMAVWSCARPTAGLTWQAPPGALPAGVATAV